MSRPARVPPPSPRYVKYGMHMPALPPHTCDTPHPPPHMVSPPQGSNHDAGGLHWQVSLHWGAKAGRRVLPKGQV